jgi:ABC-type phosphate transport system substrate-binding protein
MPTQLAGLLSGVVLTVSISVAAHAQSTDRLSLDGSTGVAPWVAALAKAYQSENATVIISIGKGMGTKARIRALNEGKIDIGARPTTSWV